MQANYSPEQTVSEPPISAHQALLINFTFTVLCAESVIGRIGYRDIDKQDRKDGNDKDKDVQSTHLLVRDLFDWQKNFLDLP